MRRALFILLAVVGWVSSARAADSLALDAYLGQVRGKGYEFRAAAYTVSGLGKQKAETDLMYTPKFQAHAVRVDDRSQHLFQQLYGDKTTADDYGFGLVKKWEYGPTTSVNYGWTRTEVDGASFPPGIPGAGIPGYVVGPSASISIPLWSDFMGKQTRAKMENARSTLEAAQFAAAYQREGVLFQARNAYWNLKLAREAVTIREDTLRRAVLLVAWADKRVARRLADDSEGLQAKAMRRVRELELQQAQEQERSACIAFNRLRGLDSDEVPETLGDLEGEVEGLAFQWPGESPRRWDLRAAEAKIRSERAAWKDAKANAWPDLKVFAAVSANGLDGSFSPANQQSTNGRFVSMGVGVSVEVPLDIFTAKKVAEGYERNYQAAQLNYADKLLETRQGWEDLKTRLVDVNRRLDMAREIEAIQKQKAEKERERLSLGRTTQFQLQSFEADYAMSRLQRLSVIAEKLSIWAEGEWMLSADRETGKPKDEAAGPDLSEAAPVDAPADTAKKPVKE